MTTDEQLAAVAKKIDGYQDKLDDFMKHSKAEHQADLLRAKRERHKGTAYIAWGFAFATLSLVATKLDTMATAVTIIITVAFAVIGFIELLWSRR